MDKECTGNGFVSANFTKLELCFSNLLYLSNVELGSTERDVYEGLREWELSSRFLQL